MSVVIASPTWVNRSTPVQSASVTMPTGRPVLEHDGGPVGALGQQRQGVADGVRAG